MKRSMLAIIPARSGSKGLKDKNILKLHGKALFEWTIDAALSSKRITDIVVTSDYSKIQDYCERKEINFIKRPGQLAKDSSLMVDVINHVLMMKNNYEDFILLQPTSPLRTSNHIDEAIQLYYSQQCRSVISVTEVDNAFLKYFYINDSNLLMPSHNKKFQNLSRQDLPRAYKPNGAIYISPSQNVIKYQKISDDQSLPYLMTEADSTDVDSMKDFQKVIKILESRVV